MDLKWYACPELDGPKDLVMEKAIAAFQKAKPDTSRFVRVPGTSWIDDSLFYSPSDGKYYGYCPSNKSHYAIDSHDPSIHHAKERAARKGETWPVPPVSLLSLVCLMLFLIFMFKQ
jgi:hypothetical protein